MIIKHDQVQGSGVTLHVASSGTGALVVLLHGFPECWYSWHRQIPALAEAGFKVLAPDLRGYNLSDKPRGVDSYHVSHVIDDVAEVVRAHGGERAHIVGHDWGGIIAWCFAARYPHLVNKLVILNAPHMGVYREIIGRSKQLLKSWYVLLFALPWIPEWRLSRKNYAAVRRMFKKMPVRPDAFSEEDIDYLVEAISRPGALTAALNYYRCGVRRRGAMQIARTAYTDAETLIIWGEQDMALGLELLEGNEKYAPNLKIHRISDAGHWVQNEAADEVNAVLVKFLSEAT